MTRDIHVLITWIRIAAVIASICSTAVPIVYASLFPWRSRPIGRLFMLQALAFAVTIDLSTMFSFWTPKDILIVFWIDAFVLTAIAGSTSAIAVLMMMMYFSAVKKERESDASSG